eukprot:TRINITY_DN1463_c1_g1_i3.p1 TRINITY_DN1463_c1_g1~~TRINITY_DN1463_c1_g1_i3.p1  ORF type:complete len:1148 (-),score=493.33 TRINITY_DN1463_c1_g1_i3:150-3593(-)
MIDADRCVNILSEHALTPDVASLMTSTANLGQKLTNKQQLVRSLQQEKLGLPIDALDRLYQQVEVKDHTQEAMPDESIDFESIKPTQIKVEKRKRKKKKTKEEKNAEKRAKKNFFGNDPDEDADAKKKEPIESSDEEEMIVEEETVQQKQAKIRETQKMKEEKKKKLEEERQRQEEEKLEKEKERLKLLEAERIKKAKEREESEKELKNRLENPKMKSYFIMVTRDPQIQKQREELPVVKDEQRVMEAITENNVVVLCGETGSGKTTQVPQFLYEAGYGAETSRHPGHIGITEPRRVAAMSMARRVANELNLPFGGKIGYQIRYDTATVGKSTMMKFMTDGILLKEIQSDFLLRKYSCIIVDEAHERSLNTDILIGLLSRIIPLRAKKAKEEAEKALKLQENNQVENQVENFQEKLYPLKLIIMSATLRVDDFIKNNRLFPEVIPPVINIDSRQFGVDVHFNKKTPENFLVEAYKKVCKIHQTLPEGGILIFLTGQQEIEALVKKLRKKFPVKSQVENQVENGKEKKSKKSASVEEGEVELADDRNADTESHENPDDEDVDELLKMEEEEEEENVIGPLHVLPLFSVLPTERQLEVFKAPPEGTRLVVVATNVAETSLTIPNITYVVDTGKVKELVYDKVSGISNFVINWTSKASANQRAGRAGRTGPGHCYRLYSSTVFKNEFPDFSKPEILTIPIEGVVLQMKAMGIDDISTFPFPTPPDRESIRAAVKTLTYLGAIDAETKKITELGQMMVQFPVAPRYAKMLILGKQGECLPYIIAIVAALTVRDPMLREEFLEKDEPENSEENSAPVELVGDFTPEQIAEKLQKENRKKLRENSRKIQAQWAVETSDLLTILNAIGAFEYSGGTQKFSEDKFLHHKSMLEIRALRIQLTNICNNVDPSLQLEFNPKMSPPTQIQANLIKQIITAGLIDQVAYLKREDGRLFYTNLNSNEEISIHPSSSVFRKIPEFLVYKEIFRTSKSFMRGITAVDPSWLSTLGVPLCQFSQPLEMPVPKYNAKLDRVRCFARVNYGPHAWPLPIQEITFPETLEKYKFFAQFLLEGKVWKPFSSLKDGYVTSPSILAKSYLPIKYLPIVQALKFKKIDSQENLLKIWKVEPQFLLAEMEVWVNLTMFKKLSQIWPLMKDL